MSLHQTILSDLSSAMKEQQTEKVAVLRMIKAAFLNAAKSGAPGSDILSDEEVITILSKEAKKRKESATAFREGNRPDLVEKEDAERAIIETYLPAQLNDEEIRAVVQTIMQENADANFGMIMGKAMQQLKGKADGDRVKQIVQETVH